MSRPARAEDLFSASEVCPLITRRGAPKEGEEANELWDTDKMQLGLQALILRDNGYICNEGVIYYRATKQRVRLPITPELENWILPKHRRCQASHRGANSGTAGSFTECGALFARTSLPTG